MAGKANIEDYEKACVAIAYNTGRFMPSKGLKQGYNDGSRYYGEYFFDFLRLSKTVAIDSAALLSQPLPGNAIIAAPTPVSATGALYEVDVRTSPLRLRSEPKIDPANRNINVITSLPDGQLVQAVTEEKINGFLEVETSLQGAHYHGFASVEYLKKQLRRKESPYQNQYKRLLTPEL